ncbi:MAG: AAA family ATPase [Bauldia litoralis]
MPVYFTEIRHRPDFPAPEDGRAGFPFDLPAVRALDGLVLDTPVTFLVGENGCGKSTVIEALAAGLRAVAVGSHDLARDPTLDHARALAGALRFVRRRTPKRVMFFRAEDAFGFTKRTIGDLDELDALEKDFEADLPDGSWGQKLAMGVARGQRAALARRYGDNPDAASHGETFLKLLTERIHPNGLYLLDEPETPLSPSRALALLSLLMRMAGEGCQFVIATHSPILMALPGATILQLDRDGIARVAWDEVEHVAVTRAFLNNPQGYLKEL